MAAPALLPPPPMDGDGAAPPAPATPATAPLLPEPKPPLLRRRPPIRVTSEFDSERRLFSHRFSCRVLDGLTKLRLRVSHAAGGGGVAWGPPEVALLARNFSVIVDPASRGAVLRGAADLAGSLHLRASHNTKATLTEDPSRDSIMLHADDKARRVEQELLRDMATLQPDKEAISVKQRLAMLLNYGEARRVEHDLSKDTAVVPSNELRSDEEARITELEPPRDPATVQPNEQARNVKLEPLSSTDVLKPSMEARTVEESANAYVALQFNRDATDVEEPPSNTAMMQCELTETTRQETPQSGELVQPN